jgi:D-glycero-D-manno-heptose 1,7-bisphosphate phosphatase
LQWFAFSHRVERGAFAGGPFGWIRPSWKHSLANAGTGNIILGDRRWHFRGGFISANAVVSMNVSEEKSLAGFGEQPCLFLDRDGVICHDIPYNTDLSKVTLRPGIEFLCERAHRLGHWIVVVSNQSGLGRGYFSWTDYRQVHQKLCALLAEKGQWVDMALCAPFYVGTEFTQAKARPHFRKPDVGMFSQAHSELGIDYAASTMVGDSATDLFPAFQLGVPRLYLVESEKQDGELAKIQEFQSTNERFHFQHISDYAEIRLFGEK